MAAADTARLIAELTLKDKMSKGVASATASVDKLEKRFGKMGSIAASGARTAGRNIERGITVGAVAAVGALGYAVKQAADQETAIAGIAKTVDGDITGLIDSLKTMASQVPVSFEELAGIAELGGAMGIASQDLAAFTKQVAILGTTTNVSTEDAATALGQMGNIIGLTGDEFDNFAASLVDLGNKGESTEAQILEIARRAGGAAKLFGIAKDETLAWSAAAANLGLNEELAGTALQNLFIKSMPAFLQGNKTLQKVTGLTAKELKKAYQEDASGALEFFLAKLGKLPEDQRLAAVQKVFGKGSGMTRLVLGLTGDMENLTDSIETGTKAWSEANAAQDEANKKWATSESQLKMLRGNIDLAAAIIGTELLPVLVDLAKEGVGFLQDPKTQQGIKTFAKDLGQGARDAAKWLKSIDWGSVASGLQAAAGFAKGLVDAFLSMPTEVKGLILGLAGLNKLTGGMVFDLGGAAFEQFLGKGSPANPMFVVPMGPGLGGPGVPGAKGGGLPGGGKLLLGLTGIGIAATLASEFEDEIQGVASDISSGWRGAVEDVLGVKIPTISPKDLEWPLGPKNAPDWAGGSTAPPKNRSTYNPKPAQGSGDPRLQPGAGDTKTTARGMAQIVAKQGETNTKLAAIHAKSEQQRVGIADMKIIASNHARTAAETKQAGIDTKMIASAQARTAQEAKQKAAVDAATQRTLLVGQTVADAVGRAGQAVRDSVMTGAVRSNTSATRGVQGTVSSGTSRIVSAIWASGRANRPVIQPTNVIEKYTTIVRGGSSSDSRRSGPLV